MIVTEQVETWCAERGANLVHFNCVPNVPESWIIIWWDHPAKPAAWGRTPADALQHAKELYFLYVQG